MIIRKEDALYYHSKGQPGKIEVVPTKTLSSQHDLALAYSPGVAVPCMEIFHNQEDAYRYTAKGNLVAVISNGTAVLGLGNIGPHASKPVMEGKGVLFKKFAGIDVFDIEVDASNPEEFVRIVKSLEPTFGAINLEDIKAPECFYIEEELKKRMNIPVMHDDQHGTAIISSAALLNALEVAGKKIEEVRIVVSGAGAAAMACVKLYVALGAKKENIILFDKDGLIYAARPNLHPSHRDFATNAHYASLADALVGADMFLGLSVGNILTPAILLKMADNPIVFALANPEPEIGYDEATSAREDIIMATGRSDHPNQVNNVLGFPYIFRGALDVRATEINEEMKLAAVKAIAALAKAPVPELVNKAYGDDKIVFGRKYLIPKPLDPRLISAISPAVAKAAIASGVAKKEIEDWDEYVEDLKRRIGIDERLANRLMYIARQEPKKVVFAEADNYKILRAAQVITDSGIAHPILLGNKKKIQEIAAEYSLDISQCVVTDPLDDQNKIHSYARVLYEKRKRKGITPAEALVMMHDRSYFGAMMVEMGEADALISGLTKDYPKTVLPALQVIGMGQGISRVAGMYVLTNKAGTFFFADTTVNVNPGVEELADIVGLTARTIRSFDIEPRIALLSYSNFGSSKGEVPSKMAAVSRLSNERYPDLLIEGDIQADMALSTQLQQENYPFSELAEKGANTFIFPDLASGNVAYKLVKELGSAEAIGPILMGMKKPVHILQLGSTVTEIVNMVTIAVVDAQRLGKKERK